MRKKVLLSLLSLLAGPVFLAAYDVDLKSTGAKADGKIFVTERLQKAIDDVSRSGGGRVILRGGTFLSAPVEIKSGVELYIDADAVLLASPDIKDYPERTDVRHYDSAAMPRFRNASFIYADEAENVAIGGRGTIDCNGQHHVRPKTGNWTGWPYERVYPTEESLPRVVFFAGCRNVSITDVTMINQPAGWSYWIHDCDFVVFDRCRILADVNYPNTDGIHINSSRDVTVSNCMIEAGDDALVVRANNRSLKENKVCERVVVNGCTFKSWACGIRLGWVNDGVIRNCCFSNIVMTDTCNGIGMWFPKVADKNDYGREATLVENITFSHIMMEGLYSHPILSWVSDDERTLFAGVRNLYFNDIHATGLQLPFIEGREGALFENIHFNDCSFVKVSDDDLPDYAHHGGAVIDRRMEDRITGVKGLVFNNTTFTEK